MELPFQNAYSGPAGEYSAQYKAIVDQYRNDVASAQELRQKQEDDRLINRGIVPPSLLPQRAGMRLPQPHYLKSGQDWYQVGADGKPQVVIDALDVQRPSRIIPPSALPGIEIPSGYQPIPYGTSGYTLERIPKPSMEDTLRTLIGGTNSVSSVTSPPLNPQPALPPPTATAPTYRPAPMMSPGEVAPPGSLVMGRNRLDAPPSTTQSTRVLDAETAKQILAKVGGDKAKAREEARRLGYSLK